MILCVLLNCRLNFDLSHQNRVVKVLTCLNRLPIQPCTAVKGCTRVTTSFYQGHGATYLNSHSFIRPENCFTKKTWKMQMPVIYSFNWAKFYILLCSQISLPAAVFCLVCKKHSGVLEKESSAEPLLLFPRELPLLWDRGSQRVTKALILPQVTYIPLHIGTYPSHLFYVGRSDFSLTGKIGNSYRSVLEETSVAR